MKKLFLKISEYLQENTSVGVSGLGSATLLEKRIQHRCFPASIVKFLRTPILKIIRDRLFLYLRILREIFFEKWKNGIPEIRKSQKSQKNYSNFRDFRDFRDFWVFERANVNLPVWTTLHKGFIYSVLVYIFCIIF